MKRTIRPHATLVYYDGPQVFEARDSIGGHYIASMTESDANGDTYLVCGVSPESLRQFRAGILDLRSLLVAGGQQEWYFAHVVESSDSIVLESNERPVPDALLPEEGFVLHPSYSDDRALQEARNRNNLVLEVSIEPPETAYGTRVRVGTLAGLLNHVELLVRHAYRWASRDLSSKTKRNIDLGSAHLMDVVMPAVPGSFGVVLEAVQQVDLFGGSELSRALRLVDDLFEHVANPPEAIDAVRQRRGRVASSYLSLLRFLTERRTGLHYSWAEPQRDAATHRSVSASEANSLVEALAKEDGLGSEQRTIVGRLEKADAATGLWRLVEDRTPHNGRVRADGPKLDGLTINDSYIFNCTEETRIDAMGNESRELYLDGYLST